MNIQQALQINYDHFLVQGQPRAFDANYQCMYEVEVGGPRCGIGLLLPRELLDDIRAAGMNHKPLGVVERALPDVADYLAELPRAFKRSLQIWHDSGGTPQGFLNLLIDFGFKLVDDVVLPTSE